MLVLDLLVDLWRLMRERRKVWLFPIVIVLALLGFLIILGQGSVVAPFIYAIF